MSRVTPPVTKLTHVIRSISSRANVARRPSGLLDAQSQASRYLPRNVTDPRVGSKSELVDDISSSHSFHTSGLHRPTPATRTIPLMQGFRTSAPKQSARDNSTIDFFFFPEIEPAAPANPFQKLRVPLLPDNYNPDRSPESAHAPESLDGALPRPEISIMAAHPENVVPATISEVVGNDGLDIDIGQLTKVFGKVLPEVSKESGVVKELWSGLMDDILGPKTPMHAL